MTANQEIDTVLVIDAQPRGQRDYRDALVRELGARQKVVEVGSMEAALALTGNLLSCVLVDPQVSDFLPEKLDSLAKKDADPWVPVVLVLSHTTPEGQFDELETEVFDVVIRGEREEGDACRAVRNGIELVELRRLVGRDLKGSDRQASSDVIAELQPRDFLRARLTEARVTRC